MSHPHSSSKISHTHTACSCVQQSSCTHTSGASHIHRAFHHFFLSPLQTLISIHQPSPSQGSPHSQQVSAHWFAPPNPTPQSFGICPSRVLGRHFSSPCSPASAKAKTFQGQQPVPKKGWVPMGKVCQSQGHFGAAKGPGLGVGPSRFLGTQGFPQPFIAHFLLGAHPNSSFHQGLLKPIHTFSQHPQSPFSPQPKAPLWAPGTPGFCIPPPIYISPLGGKRGFKGFKIPPRIFTVFFNFAAKATKEPPNTYFGTRTRGGTLDLEHLYLPLDPGGF